MILRIDEHSPVPPYEQIRDQVTNLVFTRQLADGARLPPIRQLAGDLGLAAGTVARAYRELEADGVVVSRGRKGTFVQHSTSHASSDEVAGLAEAARQFAQRATDLGIDAERALGLVRTAFTEPPGVHR